MAVVFGGVVAGSGSVRWRWCLVVVVWLVVVWLVVVVFDGGDGVVGAEGLMFGGFSVDGRFLLRNTPQQPIQQQKISKQEAAALGC